MKKSALIILSALLIIATLATACSKPPSQPDITETNPVTTSAEAVETFSLSPEADVTEAEIVTTVGKVETPDITDITVASSPATTEEIVAYFNESANKIKKDAVKVVKNFEKRSIGELIVPDILQSTAESLIPAVIKDDTEPIVYDTKEDIKTEFIVPEKDYVSRLTPADVAKATCTDNGKTYKIYFRLKDEKNPVSGKGVGSVCDVIEAHEVAEKAPSFVKELSTYYRNCEVTATIDKATGRVTHIVYSTPVALSVTVDLFGTHNVTANFTYVKDYTITY